MDCGMVQNNREMVRPIALSTSETYQLHPTEKYEQKLEGKQVLGNHPRLPTHCRAERESDTRRQSKS
jgi:hypothetical protein